MDSNNDLLEEGGSSEKELEKRIGAPKRWIREIDHAWGKSKAWREKAAEAYRTYNGEKETNFNLYHSNIETLKSSVYNQSPKPDIRGRNVGDDGEIYRDAADILENTLTYHMDDDSGVYYNDAIRAALLDYIITGFATCRTQYDFTKTKNEFGDPAISSQIVRITHVPYDRIIIQTERTWDQVEWIAYREFLNKDEFQEIFGKVPDEVKFSYSDTSLKDENEDNSFFNRAVVYELWHKPTRKRAFLTPGVDKFLAVEDDPYGLPEFFNCPMPLINRAKNTNLEPLTQYKIIKPILDEINVVTKRINHVLKMIKVIGAVSGQSKDLEKILKADEGILTPIKDVDLSEGLDKKIWLMPVDRLQQVLQELRTHRESLKQELYEITGISDIVRGASKASETATAQNIKGNFANMRFDEQKTIVADFNVNILRIVARIVAAKFSNRTLTLMSGIDVTPQIESLLRDGALLNFSINIESDSTTALDRQEAQESYTKLLTELGAYLRGMLELYGMSQQLGLQGVVTPEFVQGTLSPIPQLFKMPRQAADAINNIAQNIIPIQQDPMQSAGQQEIIAPETAQAVLPMQQQAMMPV